MKREIRPANPDTIEVGKEYRFVFLEDELKSLYRINKSELTRKAVVEAYLPFQGKVVKVVDIRGSCTAFHFYDITKPKKYVRICHNDQKISTHWLSCDFLYEVDEPL